MHIFACFRYSCHFRHVPSVTQATDTHQIHQVGVVWDADYDNHVFRPRPATPDTVIQLRNSVFGARDRFFAVVLQARERSYDHENLSGGVIRGVDFENHIFIAVPECSEYRNHRGPREAANPLLSVGYVHNFPNSCAPPRPICQVRPHRARLRGGNESSSWQIVLTRVYKWEIIFVWLLELF